MIYKPGFLSSLFNKGWTLETGETSLFCSILNNKYEIDYYDVRGLQVEGSLIWKTLILKSRGEIIRLDGLTAGKFTKLREDLENRIKNVVASRVLAKKSQLSVLSKKTDDLFNSNRYLAQSDILKWLKAFPEIGDELVHPFYDAEYLPQDIRSTLSQINEIRQPGSKLLIERNKRYVQDAINQYSYLFSRLEKYPLTDEQMKAAVIDEDRNLLIAAAGSGKSSTIVAKTVYLLESKLARPEQILVLAYNKDAQLDIDRRLKALEGVVPNYDGVLQASTFHGLGMKIMVDVEGVKPSISEMATAGKTRMSLIFSDIINTLILRDPQFSRKWIKFLTISKNPTTDLFKIKSSKEYDDYLWELGAQRRSSPEGKSRLMLPTMDGREVKSMEEVQIANWLALNGVDYEYERRYEFDTATEAHRQYYPDFYFPEAKLYHEHFALNAKGVQPPFMESSYVDGVKWKRQLHIKNKTKLIETHSADFQDGTVFEILKQQLEKHGVSFQQKSKEEIDALVKESFNPETDTQIFNTFLRHFKANNATVEIARERAKHEPDRIRTNTFLELFEKIYEEYETRLRSNDEIDFEDQINRACDYLSNGQYTHPYKYILVDEFQDISQDRKRMIDALLNHSEEAKLFAVGDDWQSIYRFSGADLDIMTHFSDHFGTTSQNYLTQTFRSYQGIVDVASTFVQRNPEQLKKTVRALDDVDGDLVFIQNYMDESDQQKNIEVILGKLNNRAITAARTLSVFLLARYNHQKPRKLNHYIRQYPKLEITFKTIHAAKGLEADYVILLNLEAGAYGFPSTIPDDPLLHLIIPRPEHYPNAEERRLFYVAITRAKRAVFICASPTLRSPFLMEVAEIPRVKSELHITLTDPCPECDTGELRRRIGKYGAFLGCSNYPSCDYTTPVICPKCEKGKLVTKQSKYGAFLSCSTFPRCRYTENINN